MADYTSDFNVSYDEVRRSCTIHFRCFDTPNSITVYQVESFDYRTEELLLEARRACLHLHELWSFSLEGSDIARLNQPTDIVAVSEETAELIRVMQAFNKIEPKFDFTVGAVSFLWKRARRLPDRDELSNALKHVGALKVSVEGQTVRKVDPLVRIDVGGAAKGYAADMVAGLMRRESILSADVDLGGNLYMVGEHPDKRPWRVSVRIPDGIESDPVIIEVQDESVVTSGSYERFVEIDGARYTHIIDARTGWPVQSDIASATVVSPSSLEADMLATTALATGTNALDELAMRHPKCMFVVITQDARVIKLNMRRSFGALSTHSRSTQ